MSPTEIKSLAYDRIQVLISELPEFPNQDELRGLIDAIMGLDYEVSETISGQERHHQAYQRRLEEE